MDWASPDEMFVRIPGIVEIRVSSDDPDFIEPEPVDLFDEQKNGLPDYYGKKDKHSMEQTWFTCIVCDCDLKSVITLRMHCKGRQHMRKTLQKEKEFRKRKKMEKDGNACDGRASSQGFKRVKREYYEDDDITKVKKTSQDRIIQRLSGRKVKWSQGRWSHREGVNFGEEHFEAPQESGEACDREHE